MKRFYIVVILLLFCAAIETNIVAEEESGPMPEEEAAEETAEPSGEIAEDAEEKEEPEITAEAIAESEEKNKEGRGLLKEDDAEGAIKAFQEAIALNPNNIAAYRNMGTAYSWIGEQDDAIKTFKKMINVAPDDAAGYRNLVLIYNLQGLPKEAIVYAEKALELNPDDFGVMGYLVYNYVTVGEYEKAVTYAQRLIEHDPQRQRPHRLLAMAYLGLGETKKAKQAFKMSYDIVRTSSADRDAPEKRRSLNSLFKELQAEVLFQAGNRYIEEGDQVKSIESYNESLKYNPADFRVYYNLAKIYEAIKEKELAMDNLKKAVGLNPILIRQIMDSSEFDSLKNLPEFQELIEKEEKKKEGDR